ncbi:MAG: aromatic ring-hydroxylating dioxygenase subunit alpha [Actinomycetota bacterium]
MTDSHRSHYRSGYGLPADVLFDVERSRRAIERSWMFVGTRGDVPTPGDTFSFRLFDDEYTLVHGVDGAIRCFVNRCAHQSARLFAPEIGRTNRRFVCPNHQWTYAGEDGRLLRAQHMPEGFEATPEGCALGLDSLPVEEVGGLLFAAFGVTSPAGSIDDFRTLLEPYTDPFALGGDGYKLAAHHREVVEANWLLVMINNRECCHCRVNHKGLCRLFDPSSFNGAMTPRYRALFDRAVARWEAMDLAWAETAFEPNENLRVARYPMQDGFDSITLDGRPACSKTIGPWSEHDSSTLSIWANPNAWIHFTSDHIATNWVMPLDEHRCELYTSWIVHEDAVEGADYELDHLKEVWLVTNAEDVELCQSMTAGARSTYYRPGPFSEDERFCTQLCDWFMRRSD